MDDLRMCGSHREAERRRCGGVLLVTRSVIHFEFKAHLTSMATTAFWSDTPSHLVCAYGDYYLFFNRTMTQDTCRLCGGYLIKKESDGILHQMTWPPQSPDLNPIEMVWDKQPTSAQHMWELLQDGWKCIPGDYLMKLVERMPRVCKTVIKAKGGYFEESKV